jgi:hypothetical protein
MAVVFRARDESLGRTVALKVMASVLAGDDEFRQRFSRESRAAAAVDHPHIIPVYDAGEADGVLYIAMRFVSGGDLRSLLYREGPLGGNRTAALLSPIASALDAAHAAGLVHRDVKPANILIDTGTDRPDYPLLSDFGLAKGTASVGSTGTGRFLGTPSYAAPEQILGRSVGPPADQYALACVAFVMLAGRPPFVPDAPMAALWAHVHETPPPVTELRPDLSTAVDVVLARALAKNPDDRFASCGEFADALRTALATAPGTVRSADRVLAIRSADTTVRRAFYPVGHLRHAKPRGNRRPLVAAAVAVALAIGLGIFLDGKPGPAPLAHAPGQAAHAPRQATVATNPSTPRLIATLTDPDSEGVLSTAFGANGTLVTVDKNGSAYVFDVARQRVTATLTGLGGTLSTDGTTLITPAGRCTASTPDCEGVVDVATRREIASFTPNNGEWESVGNATLAVSDSEDDGVDVWNIRSATLIATLTDPDAIYLLQIAISPTGTMVATSDDAGRTYLWDTASQRVIATLTEPGSDGKPAFVAGGMAFSPNGKTLAVVSTAGRTYLWNVTTHRRIANLPAWTVADGTGSLAPLSPDGNFLVSGQGLAGTEIWNTKTGEVVSTLPHPPGHTLNSVAFSANGQLLALSDSLGHTYVWNISALPSAGSSTPTPSATVSGGR